MEWKWMWIKKLFVFTFVNFIGIYFVKNKTIFSIIIKRQSFPIITFN